VHVAVAHQDELRVDSLRKERFCEGFVEFGAWTRSPWMEVCRCILPHVAIIGIRHLCWRLQGKRYIRLARRRKGHPLFFLAAQSPLHRADVPTTPTNVR